MWQNVLDDCLERSPLELEAKLVFDIDHVLEQPAGFTVCSLGRLSNPREVRARRAGRDKHDELLFAHLLLDVGHGFIDIDVTDITHLDRPEAFMSEISTGLVRLPGQGEQHVV